MKLPTLFVSVLLLMFSCKFDATPAGIYTGTLDSWGLPVNNGPGTLTIEEVGNDRYDVTFSSSGNPDIFRSNLKIEREVAMTRNFYNYQSPYGADTSFDLYMYDPGINSGPWTINFSYHIFLSCGIEFNGAKQD